MIRTEYGIPAHDGVGAGAAGKSSVAAVTAAAVAAAAVAAAAVDVGVDPQKSRCSIKNIGYRHF